jgi:hypothetical protein
VSGCAEEEREEGTRSRICSTRPIRYLGPAAIVTVIICKPAETIVTCQHRRHVLRIARRLLALRCQTRISPLPHPHTHCDGTPLDTLSPTGRLVTGARDCSGRRTYIQYPKYESNLCSKQQINIGSINHVPSRVFDDACLDGRSWENVAGASRPPRIHKISGLLVGSALNHIQIFHNSQITSVITIVAI